MPSSNKFTLQLNVNGACMAIDAIDLTLRHEEVCLTVIDDDREYDRILDSIGDHCAVVRWTDPGAKKVRVFLEESGNNRLHEVRVVPVDTMQIRWNSDLFPIEGITLISL